MIYSTGHDRAPFKHGIDFTGGTLWELGFDTARCSRPMCARSLSNGSVIPRDHRVDDGNDRAGPPEAHRTEIRSTSWRDALKAKFGDRHGVAIP